MEKLKKIAADYFAAFRSFLASLGWVLIALIVFSCFLLFEIGGYLQPKPEHYPEAFTWAWTFIQIGKLAQLVLIGFTTAFFTKFAGSMGMFQDAISNVLAGDAWLDRRNDLEDLWRKITRRVFMPGFRDNTPDEHQLLIAVNDCLTKSLHQSGVINKYYSKNVTRRIDISWEDEAKSLIAIEDFVDSDVYSYLDEGIFDYQIKFWPSPGQSAESNNLQVIKFEVDGQPAVPDHDDDNGNRTYKVSLAANVRHKIVRTLRYIQNLDEDPIFCATAGRVMWGQNVIVTVKANNLKVSFQEIGIEKAYIPVRDFDNGAGFEKSTQEVLLPEHGFIVAITKIIQPC